MVYRIESRHINQFELLLDIAGPRAIAGFVTLESAVEFADRFEGWVGFSKPIYAYTYENFETMSRERPITQVDPWT